MSSSARAAAQQVRQVNKESSTPFGVSGREQGQSIRSRPSEAPSRVQGSMVPRGGLLQGGD